jgi:hypothetical protein
MRAIASRRRRAASFHRLSRFGLALVGDCPERARLFWQLNGDLDVDRTGVDIEPQGGDFACHLRNLGDGASLPCSVEFGNVHEPPAPVTPGRGSE